MNIQMIFNIKKKSFVRNESWKMMADFTRGVGLDGFFFHKVWTNKFKFNFLFYKKFKNWFSFFTCILPNYVAHDIIKEFWKNCHFENMTAVFLLRCQNSLRWGKSLICQLNIDSWKQKLTFVYVMVPQNDQNII